MRSTRSTPDSGSSTRHRPMTCARTCLERPDSATSGSDQRDPGEINSRHDCCEAADRMVSANHSVHAARFSGGHRRGATESLRRRPIVGHGCSGSPATSTYSRARSDHMYHFRFRKPVQARVAGFPRSNRHLGARAGVSRVPLLTRDFREPVRPMSPTSLTFQGSRRVERQFVPVVPVSANLYARTHACAHTHAQGFLERSGTTGTRHAFPRSGPLPCRSAPGTRSGTPRAHNR